PGGPAPPPVPPPKTPPAAGSGSSRVHLHVARLPEEQLAIVDGVLTTDATRTVVDLARTLPFESAVVAADAALAWGLTSAGRSPADVVFVEKVREDEMRALGGQMAGWTWADLPTPAVVADRLRRAF